MVTKRKYIEVTLKKKYKTFQDLEKSKTTKDVAAKCNLLRSSHLERNEVKFLIHF